MTQEEKSLWLKDLCARVPYHPKGHVVNAHTGAACDEWLTCATFLMFTSITNNCRLYLRPMSSMTEEEKLHVELRYGFFYRDGVLDNVHIFEAGGTYDRDGNYDPPCEYREQRHVTIEQVLDFIHWLNAHHFDYRDLIKKSLAIEVTEENNPYKE